jgi:hypothetical protein
MQNEKKSARENTEDRQLAQRVRDEPDFPPTPLEHLQIGMSFAAPMEKELADYTREHGDTAENRQYASDVVYSRIEKEFGHSRALARLYIRCYRTFASYAGDLSKLTLREMMLRLAPKQPGAL